MTSYLRRPEAVFGSGGAVAPNPSGSLSIQTRATSSSRSRSPAGASPIDSPTPTSDTSLDYARRPPRGAGARSEREAVDEGESIRCSACGQWVQLLELGDHVCGPSPATVSASSSLASMGSRGYNGPALAVNVDSANEHQLDPGLRSPRYPDRHLDASAASLGRSPSSRSEALSRSPSNQSSISSASSSKMPFFDKYAKVIGSTPQSSHPVGGGGAGALTRSGGASHGLSDISNSRSATPSRPAYTTTRSQDDTTYSPGGSSSARRDDDRATIKASQSTPVSLSALTRDAGRPRGATERGPRAGAGLDACLEDLRIMTEDDDQDGGAALLDDFFGEHNHREVEEQDEDQLDTPRRRQLPFNPTTPTAPSFDSPSKLLAGRPAFSRSATSPVSSPTSLTRPPIPARSHSREPPAGCCTTCRTALSSDSTQRSGDGQPFCRPCYSDRFLPKCRKCSLAIEGRAVSDSQGQIRGKYHPGCFACFACAAPFPGMEFYVFDGRPYCQRDYHVLNGSLCANGGCGQPIEGPCVSLVGEEQGGGGRYHPEHFACSSEGCRTTLAEQHWVLSGLPWCERHAIERAARAAGQHRGAQGGQTARARKRQTIITRR